MLDFCKGCPFYFVKKEYNRRTENCLIGILPRLEKDRDNCLRNSRKRQIQNNNTQQNPRNRQKQNIRLHIPKPKPLHKNILNRVHPIPLHTKRQLDIHSKQNNNNNTSRIYSSRENECLRRHKRERNPLDRNTTRARSIPTLRRTAKPSSNSGDPGEHMDKQHASNKNT